MNLHIFRDEKFIDSFLYQYQKSHEESNNVYISFYRSGWETFKYIKSSSVEVLDINSPLDSQIPDFENIENIFMHSFGTDFQHLISQIPDKVKLYWCFFGYEYYSEGLFQNIYEKHTRKFVLSKVKRKNFILSLLPKPFLLRLLKRQSVKRLKQRDRVFSRVDFFLHWNELDFNIIRNNVKGFNAKFIEFAYVEDLLEYDDVPRAYSSEINIWLGNSASFMNNHLDMLYLLSERGDSSLFNIFCPLSYGGASNAKEIAHKGKMLFGDAFSTLINFIPLDEYMQIFNNVDVYISNQIRTGGAGNVLLALMYGKTVYMNPQNTHYKLLLELGVKVLSTSLLQCSDHVITDLSNVDRMNNKKIISKFQSDLASKYQYLP